jgi:predicted GNAT family N-acyltransferase
MSSPLTVRPARVEDVAQMARVNVRCWQETYRGLMSDAEGVVDPGEPTALWVADPNPRAQAFYRKHGFVADGTAQVEDGVREIRMVRTGLHAR